MGARLGEFLRVIGSALDPATARANQAAFMQEEADIAAGERQKVSNTRENDMFLAKSLMDKTSLFQASLQKMPKEKRAKAIQDFTAYSKGVTDQIKDPQIGGALKSSVGDGWMEYGIEEKKTSPEAIRKKELVELGVDDDIATGIAYKTYKQVTDDQGNISIYDLRNSKGSKPSKLSPNDAAALPQDSFRQKGQIIAKGTKVQVREEKKKIAANAKLDKELQSIKDDLGGPSDLGGVDSSLAAVETIIKDLKGKDIPGFGATSMLPDIAISDEGKDLRVAVKGIFNRMLKLRSGAAVTDPELKRLMEEFAAGNLKTDDQLREGLRLVRVHLNKSIGNIAAGYSPEAVSEWDSRSSKLGSTVIGNRAEKKSDTLSAKKKRLEELRSKQAE